MARRPELAPLSGELRHALEVALGRDGALLEPAQARTVGLFAARHLGAPNVVLTDYVEMTPQAVASWKCSQQMPSSRVG